MQSNKQEIDKKSISLRKNTKNIKNYLMHSRFSDKMFINRLEITKQEVPGIRSISQ